MRFEVENGKVTDTIEDADVILLPIKEKDIYMKTRYSPGFLQPLAVVDEGVVCEDWEYHEMSTIEEDEDTVLRKF